MCNHRETCSRSCGVTLAMTRVDKGKFRDSISRGKKGKTHVGVPHTEETKAILSLKTKLRLSVPENNPMFGVKRTEESKAQQSRTRATRYAEGKYRPMRHLVETTKGGSFNCRSSWERRAALRLDADATVVSFRFEPLCIPYLKTEGDRKNLRHYIPDFLVEKTDGSKFLLEVKPEAFLKALVNQEKFEAAREFTESQGMTFHVWTQKELG